MTEWFKVTNCKFVGLPVVGSNPAFFIRNIAQFGSVSILGIESHVFNSHYSERPFLTFTKLIYE